MKLPRNSYKLKEIFKNARAPEILEFNGEYFVDMLTVFPSLKCFSHRKVFYHKDNMIVGHNILFTNTVWGHFFVEEGICNQQDSLKVAVINYERSENSPVSNRIRDYIRCVDDDTLYLGRFNYIFMGKPRFLGWFSLTRAK